MWNHPNQQSNVLGKVEVNFQQRLQKYINENGLHYERDCVPHPHVIVSNAFKY